MERIPKSLLKSKQASVGSAKQIICVNTQIKQKEKMHLKMSSAEVVCCKLLPNITDELSIETNSVDLEQTALYQNKNYLRPELFFISLFTNPPTVISQIITNESKNIFSDSRLVGVTLRVQPFLPLRYNNYTHLGFIQKCFRSKQNITSETNKSNSVILLE